MSEYSVFPFDNEDAQDLLEHVREGFLDVHLILPDIGHRHIEADRGAMIIALANLIAADPNELPEGITEAALGEARRPGVADRLRQALDAVLTDASVSELYALWQVRGKVHEWKAASWVDLSPSALARK